MNTEKRSALITGSGRNIGRAIALELAGRGYNVVINGSSNEEICKQVASEIISAGGNAIVAMGDISNKADVHDIVQKSLAEYSAVDVLVNNAAIRPNFEYLEGSEDEWEHIFNTNFKSVFWLSRACLPQMLEKGWGRIVCFSGMNAQQGYPGKSAVSVSKHASWGLVKSLAKDYGAHGITSNIISPGVIVGEAVNASTRNFIDQGKDSNVAQNVGKPIDIASTVGFLCSDEAGFINGQLFQVNGGVVV